MSASVIVPMIIIGIGLVLTIVGALLTQHVRNKLADAAAMAVAYGKTSEPYNPKRARRLSALFYAVGVLVIFAGIFLELWNASSGFTFR